MFKKIALTAAAVMIAAPVFAGNPVPVRVEPEPIAPATPAYDWTGFYLGAQYSMGTAGDTSFDPSESSIMAYGAHAGYMHDFGKLVVGVEVSYNEIDFEDADMGVDSSNMISARGRIGYDAGRVMPYLTAGASQLTISGGFGEMADTMMVYGAGAEIAVTDNIRIGIEYLMHEKDGFDGSAGTFTADTISFRASFAF